MNSTVLVHTCAVQDAVVRGVCWWVWQGVWMVVRFVCAIRVPVCARVSRVSEITPPPPPAPPGHFHPDTPHPSLGSAALAMNVANPYVSSHARELTPRGSACVSAARSCVNRSTLTHRLLCPGGIFLPVGILHRNPSALFMHARSSWEGTSRGTHRAKPSERLRL